MWKCARCETNNPDDSNICVVCDNMRKQVIAENKNNDAVNDKSDAIVPKRKYLNFLIPFEICYIIGIILTYFACAEGAYALGVLIIIITFFVSCSVGLLFYYLLLSPKKINTNNFVSHDTKTKRIFRSVITFIFSFAMFDLFIPILLYEISYYYNIYNIADILGLIVITLIIDTVLCTILGPIQAAQKIE